MKKFGFTIIVLLAFFCVTNYVSAEDCSSAMDAVSIMKCHEKRYADADKELNAVYSEAMKTLTEDEKKKLRDAQRAWLKYRDTSIEFKKELVKDNRSFGAIDLADYKAKLVEKRVLELKYLLAGPEDALVDW